MTNAVAKKDPVTSLMAQIQGDAERAIPNAVTKQAFFRALQTCLRKTPKLMECNPGSLKASIMDSAQFGLVLGMSGHLVPYGKECTLIIDYKGMIEMAYRSGEIAGIDGDVVCENDTFKYQKGANPILEHTPNLRGRGEPYAAYAVCWLKGSDHPIIEVMSIDEIEKVRAGRKGPWSDWWGEMAKKTVFKRICKHIPRSIELQAAVTFDNAKEEEFRQVQATIVDDPLAAGEHNHSAPKQEPEEKKAPPKKKNVGIAIHKRFLQLYDDFPDEVDESLAEAGLPALMEIDKKSIAAEDAEIWENAKNIYMAKHNKTEE